jgi:hypothetical protein
MPTDALLTLAGFALVGAILWRLEGVVRVYLAQQRDREQRELGIREREVTLAERRAEGIEEMPPLPLDLQSRVNLETEDWAREQVRSLVQQLWTKHKHWDPVRAELANLDAQAVMSELGWSQTRVVS